MIKKQKRVPFVSPEINQHIPLAGTVFRTCKDVTRVQVAMSLSAESVDFAHRTPLVSIHKIQPWIGQRLRLSGAAGHGAGTDDEPFGFWISHLRGEELTNAICAVL